MNTRYIAGLIAASLLFTACGLKGPLYLPHKGQAVPAAGSSKSRDKGSSDNQKTAPEGSESTPPATVPSGSDASGPAIPGT